MPPQGPGTYFGRGELIKEIISFTENPEPIALIGAGGIGKTSLALTTLHHDRIKGRFGDHCRFIPGNQFPASLASLIGRLTEVIGADIENLEGLTPFRSSMPTRKMLLAPDDAGSILDSQGTDPPGERPAAEGLSHFGNMCFGVASRTPTISPPLDPPIVPTLPVEPTQDITYATCKDRGRSDIVSWIVRQLGFHTLSIALLAATVTQNTWDYDQLAKEWKASGEHLPWTEDNGCLAATIELSLASPAFQSLGPSARELLGVLAFFPQGIREEDLDGIFSTVSNRKDIIGKFCALSLAYRDNGFIKMLAPIRGYLGLRDPRSSPLLHAAKDHYFERLSVFIDPDEPEFGTSRWITSEDLNIERLLDVFISTNTNADDVPGVCVHFMRHLYWHKPRQTILKSKIEAIPDTHRSKPECLFQLSRLCQSVGNHSEQRRLLGQALKLERGWGDESRVAQILRYLSDANRLLGYHEEGIRQAREASEVYKRLGDTIGRATCLNNLAWLLLGDGQLDVAEDVASRALDLIQEKGQEFLSCESHRALGDIHHFKGQRKEAVDHFETALRIASPFDWHIQLFWIHYSLAGLFLKENGFDEAHAHIEKAKPHAGEDKYRLGRATEMQARILYRQRRLENATSEVLSALRIFEKLGAVEDAENCRGLLRKIERAAKSWSTSFQR